MRFYLSNFFILCGLILISCAVQAEELMILSNTHHHSFDVEVADTPQKATIGLMYRRHLDATKGMIFINNTDRIWHMWMKNTYISLDMIFFARDGKIIKIVSHTKPLSLDIISSDIPVAGVLEVRAGTVEKLNITVGDYIQNHRLKTPIQ